MNIKRPIVLSASFMLLFLGASFTILKMVDETKKENLMLNTMVDSFRNYHYQPIEINDNFSQNLYNAFMQRLDGRKRFLVQDDVQKLSQYELSLDETVGEEVGYDFFNLSVALLEEGVSRAENYYKEALDAELDLDAGGRFELDGEKREFPENYEEQRQLWHDIIKYEVLVRMHRYIQEQDKELAKEPSERSEDFKQRSKDEMVADAKEEVRGVFDKWFKRMSKTTRQDHFDDYLNAIASLHDPHTNYYAPIEKENFDISMSGKLEGIGARLQSDGEVTKVTEIVTGGPAWKEGTLKANDEILKVAQGEGTPTDVTGMEINEVVSYIRGKKGTEVRLYVKDAEGEEKIVRIVRDVVIMDEGYAKSLIIDYKDEGLENVGYINLPRFYADFKDAEGRQCANDVAREIQKLKKNQVNAIILDLRDNGGGSLRDVVDMAGLFIEEGPIVQVKSRDAKPQILEDEDSRVLFDGHLIILVNQFSASASEILAAAMQDYNRAVIIGSNSTFGKGTVQRFVDLDRMVWGNKDEKPLGNVKMTIQKFYRINGGSTQLKGVIPDIILPDSYQEIAVGEKEYDFAMEWSKIDPVPYKQKVRQVKNLEKLQSNSHKRVSQNPVFQLIREDAKRVKQVREDSDYSLSLTEYQAERKAASDAAKKFDDIMEEDIEGMEFRIMEEDKVRIEADKAKKERSDKWLKSIRKDVYIQEALMVMKDMMK